jgi:hypothetical protein
VKGGSGLSGAVATARLTPVVLKTSARIRLQRLWPKAIYKEDIGQIVLPLPKGADPAETLAGLLAELIPAEAVA